MLKFSCLILDHDDTVVRSEETINYPYFCYILQEFRPGARITLEEYTSGCFYLGFNEMCRQNYGFSEEEIEAEYRGWQGYIRTHVPEPFPGIHSLLKNYRAAGGKIFVVSHSSEENITRDYQTHFGMVPDEIFGWDYPETQRKPSTYPLEQILTRYGFRKDQMLMVDDLMPGCIMAENFGIASAYGIWSRTACPELGEQMKKRCTYSFLTPGELEEFLLSG